MIYNKIRNGKLDIICDKLHTRESGLVDILNSCQSSSNLQNSISSGISNKNELKLSLVGMFKYIQDKQKNSNNKGKLINNKDNINNLLIKKEKRLYQIK